MKEATGESQIELQVERESIHDVALRVLAEVKEREDKKSFVYVKTDKNTRLMIDKNSIAKRLRKITSITVGTEFSLYRNDNLSTETFKLSGRESNKNICCSVLTNKRITLNDDALVLIVNSN